MGILIGMYAKQIKEHVLPGKMTTPVSVDVGMIMKKEMVADVLFILNMKRKERTMSNTVKQSGEYIAVKVPADTKEHYLTMSDDIGYLECGVFSWTIIPDAYKSIDIKIIGLISDVYNGQEFEEERTLQIADGFDIPYNEIGEWLLIKKI